MQAQEAVHSCPLKSAVDWLRRSSQWVSACSMLWKRRRMVRITHWPDCDAIEWFRKKGPPTRCPISLYLAWCDVNILKGQRAFKSRECTVSLCFFYVSNSFARSSFGLEDAHVWNWMGIDGNRQAPQQLGLQKGTDLNGCFGIARIFAKERRYPTLNLSTSPSTQPGSLWSVVHRRCKFGSWCLEWRIEVLKS